MQCKRAWTGFVLLGVACTIPAPTEGGANANDRSAGGTEGEVLLTGAMTVSPDGRWAMMQRNTTGVLVNLTNRTTRELPFQPERFVFSKSQDVGYATQPDGDLVALDLQTAQPRWNFASTTGRVSLLRVADDDHAILVGDAQAVHVLDPSSGQVRGSVAAGYVQFATFLPTRQAALLVGSTTWTDHKPLTPITLLDLAEITAQVIDIPNCESSIVTVPNETRALLSPTFCEEGRQSTTTASWTNPDPVSVINIATDNLHFVRNLPGFGPVALSPDGTRAVAYLDTQRMDPSMFDDPSQVPSLDGDRYHLMVIDPKTQGFTLDPIGNALPRFSMTPSGDAMLVDSSSMYTRLDPKAKAEADVSVDASGVHVKVDADVAVFADKAKFGVFDLNTRAFTSFSGPEAPLDRFVQTAGNQVFTLRTRADGLGGDLYRIDVEDHATVNLGLHMRDIGLLPDKETLLLRIRLDARIEAGMAYTREKYCLSLDGISCEVSIEYEESYGVQVQECDYHDC